MACACKSKSAGQVSAVKQVVKKIPTSKTPNATVKKTIKRITYRRPI